MTTRPRVLIVEDHPGVAHFFARLLWAWGWDSFVAVDVADAMMMLHGRFDLLILDWMLPDGTGCDVLKEVRSRGIKLRVVIATALPMETVVEKLDGMETDKIVPKSEFVDVLGPYIQELNEQFKSGGIK